MATSLRIVLAIMPSMSLASPFGSKCSVKVTRVASPSLANLYVPGYSSSLKI